MGILIGIVLGFALSQGIQHWSTLGPWLKAGVAEIKAMVRK